MESSERITPDELGTKIAEAIGACADKAAQKATENNQGFALAYAEAAERLSNALAVAARLK